MSRWLDTYKKPSTPLGGPQRPIQGSGNCAEAEESANLLTARGWVIIQSAVLQEAVAWVRDETIDVPPQWQAATRYTEDELWEIALLRPNGDALAGIHQAKKVFHGTVVSPLRR